MSEQAYFTEDEQLFIGLCKHHNNELFRHKMDALFFGYRVIYWHEEFKVEDMLNCVFRIWHWMFVNKFFGNPDHVLWAILNSPPEWALYQKKTYNHEQIMLGHILRMASDISVTQVEGVYQLKKFTPEEIKAHKYYKFDYELPDWVHALKQ